MQEENQRRNATEDDPLDRLLDQALRQYAAVQPREGLEHRVLSRLRSEDARRASPSWWQWGITAAGLAALPVIIAIALRPSSRPAHTVAIQPAISAPQVNNQSALHSSGKSEQSAAIKQPRRALNRAAVAQVAEPPKLDQFPSPQPLTQQEKMLAAYVNQHYQEAALIARAREEQVELDRAQNEAGQSSNGGSGIENQ